MTKEELLASLSAKLGKTSLSERTLSSYAENVLKLVDQDKQLDDAFVDAHVAILQSMGGQLSHDVSAIVSRNNTPTPPTPPVNQNQGGNSDLDEIRKLLTGMKEEYTSLKQRMDDDAKNRSQAELRSKVSEAMKSKGAKNEYIIKQTLGQATFDEKKSVDELTEEYLKTYDANYKDCFGDSAAPRSNSSSASQGGNNNGAKFLDDFFARKVSEGKFPESTNNK